MILEQGGAMLGGTSKLRDSSGFSLIEMLVAMAIIAAIAAATAPYVRRMPERFTVDQAAATVQSSLVRARGDAVRTGFDRAVTLSLGKRTIAIAEEQRTLPLPEATALKLLTATIERIDESSGRIRFFPDGASTGGALSLTCRDRSVTVNVDWLTGAVRISEHDGDG